MPDARPLLSDRDLASVARRLRAHLSTLVPEYGRGRAQIRAIVARLLGVGRIRAERVVSALAERGLLRYRASARTIGVPGFWEIRRPRAAENKNGAGELRRRRSRLTDVNRRGGP